MNQLDISEAWQSASRLVGINREVLGAIAGVFILLPNLAFALFYPEPQIPAGLPPKEQMALLDQIYSNSAPVLLPISLLQMAGMLIMIIVMTDRSRPTVAAAIRRGALATLPYLGAQLLIGLLLATVFIIMSGLAGAIGNVAAAPAIALLMFALAATISLRMILLAPVLACEQERNPVLAMRRSWQLTQGSALRLASFLLLATLLFMVIYSLVMLFVGILLKLTATVELLRLGEAVASSGLLAVALIYAAAILASVHRQFAGPSESGMASTFD